MEEYRVEVIRRFWLFWRHFISSQKVISFESMLRSNRLNANKTLSLLDQYITLKSANMLSRELTLSDSCLCCLNDNTIKKFNLRCLSILSSQLRKMTLAAKTLFVLNCHLILCNWIYFDKLVFYVTTINSFLVDIDTW
jgi:hypothetical protein